MFLQPASSKISKKLQLKHKMYKFKYTDGLNFKLITESNKCLNFYLFFFLYTLCLFILSKKYQFWFKRKLFIQIRWLFSKPPTRLAGPTVLAKMHYVICEKEQNLAKIPRHPTDPVKFVSIQRASLPCILFPTMHRANAFCSFFYSLWGTLSFRCFLPPTRISKHYNYNTKH